MILYLYTRITSPFCFRQANLAANASLWVFNLYSVRLDFIHYETTRAFTDAHMVNLLAQT